MPSGSSFQHDLVEPHLVHSIPLGVLVVGFLLAILCGVVAAVMCVGDHKRYRRHRTSGKKLSFYALFGEALVLCPAISL